MTLLIGGFVSAILLIFGFLIKYKKALGLIAGYNTMSAEKQKNVDTEGLANFMGNFCFVFAALTFVGFALHQLGYAALGTGVLAMFFPVIIYTLIRAQQFDGNTRGADGKTNAKTKWIIGGVIAFLVLVMAAMFYSSRPATYSVEDGALNISGMYGQELMLFEVTDIKLIDTMPEVTFKNNGLGLGNVMKGAFTVKGLGRANLFVDVSKPPFIYLETETTSFIINGASEEKTRNLYEELIAEWARSNRSLP